MKCGLLIEGASHHTPQTQWPPNLPFDREPAWQAARRGGNPKLKTYAIKGMPTASSDGQREAPGLTPLAGRVVPEIGRQDVREVFLRAYRLVYQVSEDQFIVLTVFEGYRRLPGSIAAKGEDGIE